MRYKQDRFYAMPITWHWEEEEKKQERIAPISAPATILDP